MVAIRDVPIEAVSVDELLAWVLGRSP